MSDVSTAPGREGPASTHLFLAVVASGVFVTVLTGTMINVAIPLIRTEFGASAAQVGWVFTGYALAYAIGIPLYGRVSDFFGVRRIFSLAILSPVAGRLSDRVGARPVVVMGLATMGLSAFLISTFAGASPVLIAAGMLWVGAGFAFIQSPANNAAANALPEEEVGGGMGIFAGAFFLGAGTGPALIGAFLAARQEAGLEAINPLYTLDAAPFSDAFLAVGAVTIIALVAALGLRGGTTANEQSERSGGYEAR